MSLSALDAIAEAAAWWTLGTADRRQPHSDGPRRNEALYATYISFGINTFCQRHSSANRSATPDKGMSGTVDNDTNILAYCDLCTARSHGYVP